MYGDIGRVEGSFVLLFGKESQSSKVHWTLKGGGVRYSPILAPLKETGFKGRGRKLHNISTFRFPY